MTVNKAESALFDAWQNDKLSVFTGGLKIALEKTNKQMSIEVFNGVIDLLARSAYESFVNTFGADKPENIPENFLKKFLIETICGFNSVLPNGFPYVVAAIFSKSEPEEIRIGCIQRDIIPGAHDIISKNILFIVGLKNELPDGKCAIMNFHVDKVSFSGGEKLPEL